MVSQQYVSRQGQIQICLFVFVFGFIYVIRAGGGGGAPCLANRFTAINFKLSFKLFLCKALRPTNCNCYFALLASFSQELVSFTFDCGTTATFKFVMDLMRICLLKIEQKLQPLTFDFTFT